MSKFKENMKVGIVKNNKLLIGIIRTLYADVDVAIVEFDDEEIVKAHLSELAILPEQENEPVEEVQEEYNEDPTIALSREEFKNTALDLITDLVVKSKISMMTGDILVAFSVMLSKRLFNETKEND